MPAGRPKSSLPVDKTTNFNEEQFQLDQEKLNAVAELQGAAA